jgi:hypothetical protein
VAEVDLSVARFVRSADALCRLTPLEGVRLVRVAPRQLAALAGCPALESVCSLELWGQGIGPEGTRALVSSPHLGPLDELGLCQCDLGDEGVQALAASPQLTSLRRLNLRINDVGTAGVETEVVLSGGSRGEAKGRADASSWRSGRLLCRAAS